MAAGTPSSVDAGDGFAAVDDERVMAAVRDGSVDALGVLYDRYCDRAYRIARSVCRDDGHAQEAVQETFLAVWRSRGTYQARGAPAAWVLSVARNRAIDVARREDRHASRRAAEAVLHSDRADARRSPDPVADTIEGRDRGRDLRALLARLPEAQREVVTLAFYGQLTHAEIAAHLKLPPGTVKGRMRLGLERLRGDIERVAA